MLDPAIQIKKEGSHLEEALVKLDKELGD